MKFKLNRFKLLWFTIILAIVTLIVLFYLYVAFYFTHINPDVEKNNTKIGKNEQTFGTILTNSSPTVQTFQDRQQAIRIKVKPTITTDDKKEPTYAIDYLKTNWSWMQNFPFDKQNFFLLEPALLEHNLNSTNGQQLSVLRDRFNLPVFEQIYHNSNNDLNQVLTVGTFFDNQIQIKLKNLIKNFNLLKLEECVGYVPFDNSSLQQLTHMFLTSKSPQSNIQLHIVIIYQVKHFLWIGKIPDKKLLQLNRLFNPRFGRSEEIYDRFELQEIDSWKYPNDIGHFLTQIPTSRYLHCPEERNHWLVVNNVSNTAEDIEASQNVILSMKAMMKELQMEFWIVCGTLLGWLRQCNITPQDGDTDFATWSSYVNDGPITELLKSTADKYQLRLYCRYGEAKENLEYSFFTKLTSDERVDKIDLFMMYTNKTHYLMSLHHPTSNRFAYLFYPQHSLCSVELLGHKVLAPCDPERLILTEYGPSWIKKDDDWNYMTSSLNLGPFLEWTANITQYDAFD